MIDNLLSQAQGPVQLPQIIKTLKIDHRISVSHTLLRKYLREELGMRYRVLGVVSEHFDSHLNLLMRQVASREYIKVLSQGKVVFNIDESIIRISDPRK